MSGAIRPTGLLGILAALAACGSDADEANVVITNEIPADAEVEVLPPDESVGTASDELENGAADPNVNEAAVNGG
jgi:hypothetical protein